MRSRLAWAVASVLTASLLSADAALQESEGRYRALVQWSPEPTEEELAAYLTEHQAEFRTQETRTTDVLVLSPEALAREAFTLAAAKLPLRCTFVARQVGA